MRNPLISAILEELKTHPDGISEFAILTRLKAIFPEFSQLAEDADLQLFRQHFLIMNALYQLQQSLWQEDQITLSIEALEIKILPKSPSVDTGETTLAHNVDAKLAAYYLDWHEYEKTDAAAVVRLIDSFYQRMALENNQQSALDTLQITSCTPSKREIKQQYRKLVQQHHPDVGGNPETFIAIRQAYEQLQR